PFRGLAKNDGCFQPSRLGVPYSSLIHRDRSSSLASLKSLSAKESAESASSGADRVWVDSAVRLRPSLSSLSRSSELTMREGHPPIDRSASRACSRSSSTPSS